MIQEDLALLYMSFLAERISILQEMDSITDSAKYNNSLVKRNKTIAKKNNLELQYAKNNIELYLPRNISQIPLTSIIQLRASNDFEQLRLAYTKEIKNLILAKENNTPCYSLTDLLSYKRDFRIISRYLHVQLAILTKRLMSTSRPGMPETIPEVFPDARYQRCTAHFYRNIFCVIPRNKMKAAAMMLVNERLHFIVDDR